MIGMNDVHWLLENKSSYKECFWKIELEKLTNSKPGTKLFVFYQFVPMVCNDYWGDVFAIIFYV
jgi:hypothetical protein